MTNFWANPNDLPEGDPRREVNRSPKWWDRRANKSRDWKNPDIDATASQQGGGNTSWWGGKTPRSNNNKKK